MVQDKYQIGCAYYRAGFACEWGIDLPARACDQPAQTVVIDTWFYQGYFKLDHNCATCDVPYHFHVFQPFVALENPLDRPPEEGLMITSFQGAASSMLTFDELMDELTQLRQRRNGGAEKS